MAESDGEARVTFSWLAHVTTDATGNVNNFRSILDVPWHPGRGDLRNRHRRREAAENSHGSSTHRNSARTVTQPNVAPVATNLSAPETYTEDTALNLIDIVVSDIDSPTVTVTLTLSDLAAGSLNTGTSGAVTSTFSAGVWTASGAIANVNTLLAGLTFTPALNYNSNFTIATSVSDGLAPALTGSKAMTGRSPSRSRTWPPDRSIQAPPVRSPRPSAPGCGPPAAPSPM